MKGLWLVDETIFLGEHSNCFSCLTQISDTSPLYLKRIVKCIRKWVENTVYNEHTVQHTHSHTQATASVTLGVQRELLTCLNLQIWGSLWVVYSVSMIFFSASLKFLLWASQHVCSHPSLLFTPGPGNIFQHLFFLSPTPSFFELQTNTHTFVSKQESGRVFPECAPKWPLNQLQTHVLCVCVWETEQIKLATGPSSALGEWSQKGLWMEVFSGLSLGAQREEMAVFKGRGDTVSLHNYVSLVFMDLFSQDEKMPALTFWNSILSFM